MFTHSSALCLVDIWVGRDRAGGGANCVPIHEWMGRLEIISSQMISSSVLNFLLIVPPPTLSHHTLNNTTQQQSGLNLAGHLTTRPFRGAEHKIVQNHNSTYSRNLFEKEAFF